MINYDLVAWGKVYDYLLHLESAHEMGDFLSRAVTAIDRLIPSDVASTLLDTVGRLISKTGVSDATQRAFNDYYRFRIPLIPDTRRAKETVLASIGDDFCFAIDWRDYRDSEFVTDYVRPCSNVYTLTSAMPEFRVRFSLHRSSMVSTFSERDRATLAILGPHLTNLYSCFEKLVQPWPNSPCVDEILEYFPRVSKREAEIAVLLCQRLTAAEIASKLFISVRTVEVHLAHLYMKLGVRSKRQAISLLTTEPA